MSQKGMKKHVWLSLVFLLSIKVYAQEAVSPEPLYTDRPGQSINPYTVGNRALQVQSGYGYARESSPTSEINLHSLDINTKLGISNRFEISALFQISSLRIEREALIGFLDNSEDPDNGFSAFSLSTRGTIMKGEGLKPAIGLEATYIANGVPGEELSNTNGRFILTLQNQPFDKLSFTGNVVYFTNDRTEFTANLGYSITSSLGIFAEYRPILEARFDGESGLVLLDSYLNTGVFWQLGDDFMLDLAGGFRVGQSDFIDDDSDSYYLQVGFTKRFWL
jgi:hypothetical protein